MSKMQKNITTKIITVEGKLYGSAPLTRGRVKSSLNMSANQHTVK